MLLVCVGWKLNKGVMYEFCCLGCGSEYREEQLNNSYERVEDIDWDGIKIPEVEFCEYMMRRYRY